MLKYFIALTSISSMIFSSEAKVSRDSSNPFLLIGIAILFFYFVMFRPEQKKRKSLEEQRNKMKKGSTVVAMGIVATIHSIKENTVVLQLDGAKMEILKAAISEVREVIEEK